MQSLKNSHVIGEKDKFIPLSSSKMIKDNVPSSDLKTIDKPSHIRNLKNTLKFKKYFTAFLENIRT